MEDSRTIPSVLTGAVCARFIERNTPRRQNICSAYLSLREGGRDRHVGGDELAIRCWRGKIEGISLR